MNSFSKTLAENNLKLVRGKTITLQVNMGLLCNQLCRHCHLNAGPHRQEVMNSKTADSVASYVLKSNFTTVDFTGGAPELNQNTGKLIDAIAGYIPRIIIRVNLTALLEDKNQTLLDLLIKNRVVIMASFPALGRKQLESQRGHNVFYRAIECLRKLNNCGYGIENSNLELSLIANPTGAYLPPDQSHLEKRFKKELERKYNVRFNNLFCIANVPLGRYRDWLEEKNMLDDYMSKLKASFNPCSVEKVMCRSQISVDWKGYLYDCDFNIAANLPFSGQPVHIDEFNEVPAEESAIITSDHCYTCTAGAGFT